jgi:ABC-type lipoprotein export system ATPase subunit/ABC-type lipoprotein release transport system permease subunit
VDAGRQAALIASGSSRGKTGGAAMNERSATALTIGPEQVAAPGDAVTHAANDASAPKRVVISLRDVRKSYTSANGEKIEVLRGVNLDVEAGSFNVIRGESGSGKTSLLRILGMLDTDFTGDYLFAGDSLKAKPDWYRDELRANNIGFVFQEGQLFGHMRIRENITLPVRLQGAAEERRSVRAKIEKLAPAFFTKEELEKGILSNRPSHVSGGQKQRAAIMRSVVNRPALLLADEPTASLDEERKHEILKLLVSLCEAGHTVVVVSHDKVFYQSGRQLELANGVLREIAPGDVKSTVELPVRRPAGAASVLFGWNPRAPLAILIGEALRETFLRPIFLFLILISLCVGVSQIGVFSSVIVGAQVFLNEAMTKGSRLNRLEVKPRTTDLANDDRFPFAATIKGWSTVQAIVPRRATLARVLDSQGVKTVYSAMGLHPGDPEYRLLTFVAGGPFSPSGEELEVIVTAALLSDLFADAENVGQPGKQYADFLGRFVTIEVPQFSRTGEELAARARRIQLKIVGIILYAEGGRQLYLPNTTQLVFDRYKMDRDMSVVLPLNEGGDAWNEDRADIEKIAAFPWEDQLHVYAKEIRDIIPVFQQLSQLGYKPSSDIWNYKWVLDIRDLAWKIFVPLLVLIVAAVALTVATNLFSSAKLRETEFALWRVLGMRRGDLVFTQVVSTALVVLTGAAIGLLIATGLVNGARAFLAEQSPGGGLDKVFAPVEQFFLQILVAAVVVGVFSALYPAVRTAHADPAKVLQK